MKNQSFQCNIIGFTNIIALIAIYLSTTNLCYGQDTVMLSITYTSIEDALKEPDKVYHLQLHKKKLQEFPKEILSLRNLATLDLSKNKLTNIPSEIGNLANLKKLNLSKNNITTFPKEIGNLQHLDTLIAFQNQITHLPNEIGQLSELIYLDIWGNEITKLPNEISNLKKLKTVDMRVIDMTKSKQQNIQNLLPNTKLFFSKHCNCGE